MSQVLSWFIATVITLPLLGWYVLYLITVKLTKKKARAIRVASDGSVVLFMAAVYFIMYELWGRSFLWMILAIFFFIAMVFTWLHWQAAGDIYTRKLLKGIWRVNFLLFFFLYLVLSGYGLISRLITS
ncbi:DUF3397 domain-containing protein [Alkalihalobacillus oceani]|uniref:DUF3397 domain-containing protein n=1 Tax=Halalkalibacter oceani TaxID=1653776 RepID=UPI00203EBBB1|nr:DUF3397 domain-containing protein [Halalkalibacter oceani]MCM3759339.1 DUF3397 domain-containing protein [Halalkalibacter oceani]